MSGVISFHFIRFKPTNYRAQITSAPVTLLVHVGSSASWLVEFLAPKENSTTFKRITDFFFVPKPTHLSLPPSPSSSLPLCPHFFPSHFLLNSDSFLRRSRPETLVVLQLTGIQPPLFLFLKWYVLV